MKEESCNGDVGMVHPATMAATATMITSIAAPFSKLELNRYYGPPLLLQTREAKQEAIERPLGGLLGLKHLISAPNTLSNARAAPVVEHSVSSMGPDLSFSSSFAITFGEVCAASSYKVVEEVQCSSSIAGRWRDQRYVNYHHEFEFETCPSSCFFHYIRQRTSNPGCVSPLVSTSSTHTQWRGCLR